MELYLLRHGTSVANEMNLVCGASDYPLSNTGIIQAQHICNHFRNTSFSKIYSSSLTRAKNTITHLGSETPISIHPELVELNTGNLSHLTLTQLWKLDDRFRKPWLYPNMRYPEGESFNDMVARITDWYMSSSVLWKNEEKVLIVGHEGTIRVIYMLLYSLDLADYPDFPINNCDHLYFNISNGKIDNYMHISLKSISEK